MGWVRLDRKKMHLALEQQICWILSCSVLLVSNMTLFRKYQASIGGDWFNFVLLLMIIILLFRLLLNYTDTRRTIRAAEAAMAKLDRLDDDAWVQLMESYFHSRGWEISADGGTGFDVMLRLSNRKAAVRLLRSKRKIGSESVKQAYERMKKCRYSKAANGQWGNHR